MRVCVMVLVSAFAVGCADDISSTGLQLDNEEFGGFTVVSCPTTAAILADESEWRVDGLIINNEYVEAALVADSVDEDPLHPWADLTLQVAATVQNESLGLVLPDGIRSDLEIAEAVLAKGSDDLSVPPAISQDILDRLDEFNNGSLGACLDGNFTGFDPGLPRPRYAGPVAAQ